MASRSLAKILLKGSATSAGESMIIIKGKGGSLPLPSAPSLTATSVTVQLHGPGAGLLDRDVG